MVFNLRFFLLKM